MNKITHNKHGRPRVCNRCHNTEVPTVVRVKSEYLCEECKQKRIARQRQNNSFVHNKCKCGKTIGKYDCMCWGCLDAMGKEREFDNCNTVEELKNWIKEYLL
jgi:hypothetical protein